MQYQLSCLLFIKDNTGRILMIKRRKPPNLNTWSPPGGKVEMNIGESPYECAIREAYEEVGLKLQNSDLRLFGYISEKSYEGKSHWLMFLFDCLVSIKEVPAEIDEGHFQFYSRGEIDRLSIPLQTMNWFGHITTVETRVFGVLRLIVQELLSI